MHVDASTQTIVCKIVYYGPGLSGKSSNFTYLMEHAAISSGELMSKDVDAERILHFQCTRDDLAEFKNYRVVFELHTIPGQSYYINSRLDLLDGADGIVFVVDSRREAMDENIDSMNDLYGNLRTKNIANDIPLVVQFNKQDLASAIPIAQLEPLLNSTMKTSFSSSAVTGEGIIETMQHITSEAIQYLEAQGFESSGSYSAITTQQSPLAHNESLTPIKSNALGTDATLVQGQTDNSLQIHSPAPESMFLTCYSCESMLEVPRAQPGDLFACGTCKTSLRVIDPDHGITGVVEDPIPTPGTATLPKNPAPDASEYGMPTLGAADIAPLSTSNPIISEQNSEHLPEILPQYITLAALDESLLGNRYMLQDKNTGLRVRALLIHQEIYRQPAFQATLETRIRHASQIRHQGISGFIGLQYAGALPVILTQDTEDHESLATILQRRQKMTPPQAIEIAHKIALALEAAAHEKLYHGWLRPECILISSQNTVVIDDLIPPKQHAYLVRESHGRSAASAYYLAPEHGSVEIQSDERGDIFLIGLLLFKMITNDDLVVGFNAHEALHKIKSSGCRSLRSLEAGLSREIDTLCSRMTAIERRDRIQTMHELGTLLAKFGGGAKRHTLRATRATIAHTQTHTHAHTANNTQNTRRSTGTGKRTRSDSDHTRRTQNHTHGHTHNEHAPRRGRTAHGANTYNEHTPHAAKKSGSPLKFIILFLILAAGAAYGWKHMKDTERQENIQRYDDEQKRKQEKQDAADRAHADTPPSAQQPLIRSSQSTTLTQMLDAYEEQPQQEQLTKIMTAIQTLRKSKKKRKLATQMQSRLNDIRAAHSDAESAAGNTVLTQEIHPDTQAIATITETIAQEKFATARSAVKNISDPDMRTQQLHRINRAHTQAQSTVQAALEHSATSDDIDTLLRKARYTWGTAEDRTWAEALHRTHMQRLALVRGQDATPNNSRKTATQTQTASTQNKALLLPTYIHGMSSPALLINKKIQSLLRAHAFTEASTLSSNSLRSGRERRAIALMIQLYQQSTVLMPKAFKERGITFRIQAPFKDAEKWSLTAFNAKNLQIESPQGSQTSIEWKSLNSGTTGELYGIIAAHADGSAKEFAMSSVAYLIDNEIGRAKQSASKANRAGYTNEKELLFLVALNKHAPLAHLCQAVVESTNTAIKKPQTIARAQKHIYALKAASGSDNDKIIVLIERAESALQVTSPTSERNSDQSTQDATHTRMYRQKNRLDFSDPDDILAFPERTDSWTVSDGALHYNSTSATAVTNIIARQDAQHIDAISFDVTRQAHDDSQRIAVHFKGVQLQLALTGEQGFQLTAGTTTSAIQTLPFIAQLPYHIRMQRTDGRMHVTINHTAQQSIALDTTTNNTAADIAIHVTGSTSAVLFDNIELTRQAYADLPPVDAEKQALLKSVLGWDAVGGAELHVPQIILPPWPGSRSAIVRDLTAHNTGVRFEATGTGDLFIALGDRQSGKTDGLKIPMPFDGTTTLYVNATWDSKNLRIESRAGTDGPLLISTIEDMSVPLKQLSIESSRRIVILKPPQLQ